MKGILNIMNRIFNLSKKLIVSLSFAILILVSACAPAAITGEPFPTTTPSTNPPTSNLPVITYHREGGIAGFCDDVLIYANGSAKISSCKSAQKADVTLSVTQLATLTQWLDKFQGFDYQHKDPAVADAMTVSLKLIGNGQNQASDADIQAILGFLSQIAFQYNR